MGVCALARVSAAPRDSWLGFSVCVCLCAPLSCTPPVWARVCGVGVFAWARVSPRHFWLGCWGVGVFVCTFLLYPANPSCGVRCGCVCLGAGFRHSWRGCWVVCVCLCARSAASPPLLAWGWGVGVCAWAQFWLCPATPSWGVGVCVCFSARFACTPQIQARVCGVGQCAWARFSAAPRQSRLEFWGVCVSEGALCLNPATPGSGVRCGCVCAGSGFGCAPRILAWVLGCVCVCVCALLSYTANPGWDWRCGCMCFGSLFGCAVRFVAGVLGCVCVCVRGPLVPRH